jgi:hypothetical protein
MPPAELSEGGLTVPHSRSSLSGKVPLVSSFSLFLSLFLSLPYFPHRISSFPHRTEAAVGEGGIGRHQNWGDDGGGERPDPPLLSSPEAAAASASRERRMGGQIHPPRSRPPLSSRCPAATVERLLHGWLTTASGGLYRFKFVRNDRQQASSLIRFKLFLVLVTKYYKITKLGWRKYFYNIFVLCWKYYYVFL